MIDIEEEDGALVLGLEDIEGLERVPMGAQANNGMHPTANSAAFMRETWLYRRRMRGG